MGLWGWCQWPHPGGRPGQVPAACPSCHTPSSTLPLNSRSTPSRPPFSALARRARFLLLSSPAQPLVSGTASRIRPAALSLLSPLRLLSLTDRNHRMRPWYWLRACRRSGAHCCCPLLRPALQPHASLASSPPFSAPRTSLHASSPTTLPLLLLPAQFLRGLLSRKLKCLASLIPPRGATSHTIMS